eukprot:8091188-Ditylum_brightwellii.AAC.1
MIKCIELCSMPIIVDLTTETAIESSTSALSSTSRATTTSTGAAIKGKKQPNTTWEDQAIAAYMFLHPQVHGTGGISSCIAHVTRDISVNKNTVQHWISCTDSTSVKYIQIWYPIV